jgi:hypothetical protein
MKTIYIALFFLTVFSSCKREIGTNMINTFPKFDASESDYSHSLGFSDSISGTYEYASKANWFYNEEKNIAVVRIYLKSETAITESDLKNIEIELDKLKSKISNAEMFDQLKYVLFQNGKEFHTILKDNRL